MNIITSAAAFLLFTTAMLSAQQTDRSTPSEQQIETIVIKKDIAKGSEQNLLSLQRKSVEVMERVGAAQLQKQGIGNAATAVTKASGTQKQEGSGQIVVRGLGDRYNMTTLNGLPIPSDDPELKNVNLEIFKTSIIEYIALDKVYQPKLSGDFGGAAVQLVSKEHTGKPYLSVELGSSVNLQTVGQSAFKIQDGAGYLGYRKSTFHKGDPSQIYPFTTKWNFKNADNPHNSSFSIEGGARLGKFSVFAYTGFDNDYTYSAGSEGFYDASGDAIKALDVARYTYRTNHTALVNITRRINAGNKISFTSDFIHSSVQDARFFRGYMREIGSEVIVNRGDNKITSLWINQLYGTHQLPEQWNTDWALSYNILQSERPDRLQNTIDAETQQFITASTVNNHRYFDALDDRTLNGSLHVWKQLNQFKLQAGYQASHKNRHFDHTTIGLNFTTQISVDPADVDAVINAANNSIIRYNSFRNDANRFVPFWYEFKQNNQALFANVDYSINENLTFQLGGRYEYIDVQSGWDDVIFNQDRRQTSYNKFLPAFNMKYEVSNKQNLRFSASKTYTLPQAKELVPIGYYDVTTNVYGNPDLYPSDNYNADLKWEFFSRPGEIISAAVFAKYLLNPIARTTYSTSASSDMTYFNIADHGYVTGVEIEFRKDLYTSDRSKLYTFLNATYMHSGQKLKTEAQFAEENNGKTIQFSGQTHDAVQGVADFLANINLGYQQKMSSERSADFVVSYAYVGESLFALGTNQVGNFYETPVHLLDATLKFNLNQIGIGLTAKNLLNPENKIEQRTGETSHVHRSYTQGRQLGLTLSYKF